MNIFHKLFNKKYKALLIDLIIYRQDILDEIHNEEKKGHMSNIGKKGCVARITEIIDKYI